MTPQSCQTLGLAPSFGFGDRIGLATPGHLEAMRRAGAGIEPIYPQQSIREMARTSRSPQQVMQDAMQAAAKAGWTTKIGADADHLKTADDIEVTVDAGFTFFTFDPSDHVDQRADNYDESELRAKFDSITDEISWLAKYQGKSIALPTGTTIELSEEACFRAAVKYGKAIQQTQELATNIKAKFSNDTAQKNYEIELSVDETLQPTTLAEHYIIADQCLGQGIPLVSLAPRFIGDFEKGVDYKGNVEALERSLNDHAAIASMLGPYKISLHSGSDKLSIYPALARATHGQFHVKTAGTSYLEALRVVAHHDNTSFREIIEFARECYDRDKATYHVSATLPTVPAPDAISDDVQLEQLYLERWCDVPEGKGFTEPGRQILHCTFGSVLTSEKFGPLVRQILEDHPETYCELLAEHFQRHLQALSAGM